ncbi:MAG: D-alanyl-D-alanine carboxypeptidase family protein [Acutalibacteraceae bacterium]
MKKVLCFLLSIILIFSLSTVSFSADVVKENEDVVIESSVVSKAAAPKENLPVEVKAKSAILMDVSTGEVLLEYNADEKLFPASVTKIMTMLLVCEAINSKKIALTDVVACSENAASKGGSQIWLEVGETMTVDELLRATAIGSANDAATLLGEYVAGSETAFIDLMNEKAKELHMKNTTFCNATGLDDSTDENLTTARDIGIMSIELLKYDFITDYTTVWMDSLRNGKTELVNTNRLVRFYNGTTGLKTGTTSKAGCCVSASAKRDNMHLVAVVMGSANSTDRFETAKNMLNYGFSNYTTYVPEVDIKENVKVIGGKEDFVDLTVPHIKPMLLKKGQEESIEVKTDICEEIEAPVSQNQKLGKVKIILQGETLQELDVVSACEVQKQTVFGCFFNLIKFISGNSSENS